MQLLLERIYCAGWWILNSRTFTCQGYHSNCIIRAHSESLRWWIFRVQIFQQLYTWEISRAFYCNHCITLRAHSLFFDMLYDALGMIRDTISVRVHSFSPTWIWILWLKIRFFIPFHCNLILDCNPNNPPPEADNSDWYLKTGFVLFLFHLINRFIDFILIVWLHEPLTKSLKGTSTQGLPCENRSAFGFYVPAGQQSDPIFHWRI